MVRYPRSFTGQAKGLPAGGQRETQYVWRIRGAQGRPITSQGFSIFKDECYGIVADHWFLLAILIGFDLMTLNLLKVTRSL
jgi:hypothetical protein